jgi:hypothetical protein
MKTLSKWKFDNGYGTIEFHIVGSKYRGLCHNLKGERSKSLGCISDGVFPWATWHFNPLAVATEPGEA